MPGHWAQRAHGAAVPLLRGARHTGSSWRELVCSVPAARQSARVLGLGWGWGTQGEHLAQRRGAEPSTADGLYILSKSHRETGTQLFLQQRVGEDLCFGIKPSGPAAVPGHSSGRPHTPPVQASCPCYVLISVGGAGGDLSPSGSPWACVHSISWAVPHRVALVPRHCPQDSSEVWILALGGNGAGGRRRFVSLFAFRQPHSPARRPPGDVLELVLSARSRSEGNG